MLDAYLSDSVIIHRISCASGDEGESDAPGALQVRGRLAAKPHRARNFAGVAVDASHELWLAPVALDGREAIRVAGREFAIVRIEPVRAFDTMFLKLSLI